MRRILTICGLTAALTAPGYAVAGEENDPFANVAATLAEAGCIEVDFLSIIESDIFNTIDSTHGRAILEADGRYNIALGDDRYLFTGAELYSYSAPNNQVVIEQVPPQMIVSDQFSFLTRLDSWYDYSPLDTAGTYRLILKEEIEGDMPDTMTARIDQSTVTLQSLSYQDINDELNRIIILHQSFSDSCAQDLFSPDFPDSADVLRL